MTASTIALTSPAGRRTLIATILASAMAFIDGSALNVALAVLQDDLGATGVELLWIVNAYMLLLGALILLGGALGDRLGRNRVFRTGIMLFAGASLACGLAPTTPLLIAARAVQGIGGALLVPGSLAILTATINPDERGRAIGYWSSATTITTVGGPILGGLFADVGFWRGVFLINLPLAVVAVIALRAVPETRDEDAPEQLDYPGAILTVLGLAGLTFGLIQVGERGVTAGLRNPVNLIALAAGVVMLLAFVWVEARSTHPLVNLNLFRSRAFSGTNLITGFLYGALSGGMFFLPLNLIQVQGYDSSLAGLTLLPFSILLTVLSPWAGRLVDRTGPRLLLTVGPVLVGAAFIALALPGLTGGPADFWLTYFPGIVLLGLGMGLTVAPLTTTVMNAVPSQRSGTASGINNAVSRQAQVVMLALFGAVALGFFSVALDREIDDRDFTPQQASVLRDQASDLANAAPPQDWSEADTAAGEAAIHEAFVATFRPLMLLAAGLCGISALLAAVVLGGREEASAPA